MRPLAPLILFCLIAASCQAGPIAPSLSPTDADILIASDLPTSGSDLQAILPLQQAIQLAIDQHPTVGGFRLRYQPFDDALAGVPSQQKGAENVTRMVADPRVLGMVGPYNSVVASNEIPVANAGALAMVSPSNTYPCLTQASPACPFQPDTIRPTGHNNYFRTAAPEPVQGRAMARFLVDNYNVKRAAAFTLHADFADPIIDGFAAELQRLGGELVLRQVLPQTTDFAGFLAAAKSRGAEAIYTADGLGSECEARAQMKGIFPNGAYFLGIDGLVFPECVKFAEDNAGGMLGTVSDVDLSDSTDPAVKTFLAGYHKAHPKTTIAPYTFAAYDCALILIEAIKQAIDANGGRVPSRTQVVDTIAHSTFKGLTNVYSFDTNGDAISPLMSVYQVKTGRWVYLRQVDASVR